ncbi:MAG TPA: hypothetical protein VGK41_09920 [Solirubrobacterales bacterium]
MTSVLAAADRAISAAQMRAERIRVGMHSYIATRREIAAAYAERDWVTLAYPSFEEYVESEFSETRLRLSPDERRDAVAEFRRAGMSQRAIGAALGVGVATVNRDLATVPDETVPDEITGTDGRKQPATRPAPKPQPAPEPGPQTPEPPAAPTALVGGSGIDDVDERPCAHRGDGEDCECNGNDQPTEPERAHPSWPTEAELKPWESLAPTADRIAESMEPEPETCLGTDMDCGRPLPCPNHPRTPAERIAAVAEVAPEFVKPAPAELDRRAAEQRDARARLRRAVDLLIPAGRDSVESWAERLGSYDEELSALVKRATEAIAVLDELIERAGQ